MRLAIKGLETWELLASNLTANLSDDVLRIEGTNAADQIRVRQSGNQISLDIVSIVDGSVSRPSVAAS